MRRYLAALLVGVALLAIVMLSGGPRELLQKALNLTEAGRLMGLLPQVQDALIKARSELRGLGIELHIGSTLRTVTQQAGLVTDGKSATSHSWHLLGRALDAYPKLPDGQPDLNGTQLEKFRTMHNVAAKYGFRGLAFNPDGSKRYVTTVKGKVWDGGHLEFPEGMTFAQAAAKQGIKVA